MIKATTTRCHRFLFGGAIAAFAASFALPVLAQSIVPAGITASGTSAVTTDQSQSNTAVTASAIDPFVDVNGNLTGSSVTVSGNSASAAARANKAVATLSPTSLDPASSFMNTSISTGASGTSADASALIATRQMTDQSAVTGTVDGPVTGARIGAVLGDVSASSAKVTGNTQEAIALANDASATTSLTGDAVVGGIGIVSDQAVTGNSAVTADQNGTIRLRANSASGSDLALTGNLERAIAYGSSATNSLSVDAASVAASPTIGTPSAIQALAANPSVNANFAVVSDQRLQGSVQAIDSGWFNERVFGAVDGSSLSSSSNSLIAAGYGNQSANSLSLAAPSIANNADMGGAIADVTNFQQVGASSVGAISAFGSRLLIDGTISNSTAALKDNSVLALATGNWATSNLLTVTGGAITAGAGTGSGYLDETYPVLPVVGAALADPYGAMTVSAPFSLQNDQLNQGTITATIAPAQMPLAVAGAVVNSSLVASGNSATGVATGNSATNGLTLAGTSLATAAGLNSLQIGQGQVAAAVGSIDEPAGVLISAGGSASNSSLGVTGNSIAGNATANSATNTLGVTGVSLVNISGRTAAQAGATDAGIGAVADYALANNQQIRGGYQLPVAVTSDVKGSFGILATGGVTDSSLTVSNNNQASSALGNGASNTLTLTAVSLGGADGLAPGSALSSVQFGQSDVKAVSDMALATSGETLNSALTISGNTNAATAQMNSATNVVTVDAAIVGARSGDTFIQGGMGSVGVAVGDHVLANNQRADGSVTANALTTVSAAGVGLLDGSSVTISGNQSQALATANMAVNSLTLTSATGTSAAAGLGNSQQNYAGVAANASTVLADGSAAIQNSPVSFTGNTTSSQAQGNSVSNAMTLTSGANFVGAPDLALATTGPLNGVSGPAVLSNVQMNAGMVLAVSTSPNASVGGGDLLNGSSISATGNAVTASAYGNNATNAVTLKSSGALPAAAITNTQMNNGPVTAEVVSASYTVSPGAMSGSRVTLTGNTGAAQAIGNYAASTITATR